MLTITAPASATEGGIDFQYAPTPLANVLSDHMLIRDSLAPVINSGELAAFLDFLVRSNRLEAAIYLAWRWAESDEDARWEISDDDTTFTIYTISYDEERVATLTDPSGVSRHLAIQ